MVFFLPRRHIESDYVNSPNSNASRALIGASSVLLASTSVEQDRIIDTFR